MKNQEKKVLGIIATVLGVIALIGSWVPIINNISFVFAVIALILGIIGLIANRKNKKTLSLTGALLAIISIIVVVGTQAFYSSALNSVSDNVSSAVSSASSSIESSANADFKWTQEDIDSLAVGDITTGAGGTNYNDIIAKFGQPSNESESSTGNYSTKIVTYDNAGASDYKNVTLQFTQSTDGNWLLTSKSSSGI